jgi:hypothetical protein
MCLEGLKKLLTVSGGLRPPVLRREQLLQVTEGLTHTDGAATSWPAAGGPDMGLDDVVAAMAGLMWYSK